jgi:hypothetical protein
MLAFALVFWLMVESSVLGAFIVSSLAWLVGLGGGLVRTAKDAIPAGRAG